MKYFLILFLLIPTAQACEGVYVEFGAGRSMMDTEIIESPMGRILIGYENSGWLVELDHISSLPDTNDSGIEALWISKRIYF
jgi:hypothetical protein